MNEHELVQRVPFSMEAEQSVLGAILINPRAVLDAVSILHPSDFYLPQNAAIFEAVYELFSAGDVVDSVTISERLRQSGHYDPDTTPQYLLYLAEFTPSSANTQRYARIVYEKAMLRALISASEQIAQNCMAEAGEFSLLMDQAEQLIYDLSHGRRINEMRPIAEVVDEAYTRISELFNASWAESPRAFRSSTPRLAASHAPTSFSSPRAPASEKPRWPSTSQAMWRSRKKRALPSSPWRCRANSWCRA